ncbi:hypothetical protein A4A49_06996 [Nicotiana attenuata]|uniref:Uncharacterized protein n=1 Tax=Nicotiana attenuata TaxID=49451 RepID=A0A1J6IM91_NICAT|nr:hypothetical protein A4A49_06996 [Nicotiana attenuata]
MYPTSTFLALLQWPASTGIPKNVAPGSTTDGLSSATTDTASITTTSHATIGHRRRRSCQSASPQHIYGDTEPEQPLTLTMHENIERRFLILAPPTLETISLNIRLDPYSVDQKYVTLLIPTMHPQPPLQEAIGKNHQLTMTLEMALAPGGRSSPTTNRSMKNMLWNYRGANNQI